MLNELYSIGRYLKLMFKNLFLIVILVLDLVGVVSTYFGFLNFPYWIYLLILLIALFLSSYNIYKSSSPRITVEKPNPEDISLDLLSSNFESFDIKFKTYISNFGLQSGSLEYVKVNFIDVNGIGDSFIVNQIGITPGEILMSKENRFPSFSSQNPEYLLSFPMVLPPDTIMPIFIKYTFGFRIFPGSINEKLEWIENFQLEIEYKVKDTFGVEDKKIPFLIDVGNLLKLEIEKENKQQEIEEKMNS